VQIVESWGGNPGQASTTPRKGMCHPMAHAQHAHRVQMVHPQKETCVSQALASHPHQATVLSGSAPGYVHAWRFCDGSLKATYAPMPLSHHMVDAHSSAVPQPSQVLHWTYARSLAYSASGCRFAAIGKGGWVALWRHDAQWANTPHGRVGCCDWTHQCIAKRGAAISFVGSRSTLLMAAGANSDHQDVTMWDITVPLRSSCVGVVQTSHHVVDAKISSDGVTTITVDRHGDVNCYDMRMLKGANSPAVTPAGKDPLLWGEEKVHAHGATCVSICPHQLKMLDNSHTLAATGGRDGKVCLWNLQAGAQVQALTKLHSMANRGLFGFTSSEERVPSKVKGIDFDAVGLVSVGHNDSICCVPWSSHP
jgi:WD40 repeat protein